jgi:hypothetical protein
MDLPAPVMLAVGVSRSLTHCRRRHEVPFWGEKTMQEVGFAGFFFSGGKVSMEENISG